MTNTNKYNITAPDWRGQLRRNQRRTRWVMFSFVALYLLVGLLVDVVLNSGGSQMQYVRLHTGEDIAVSRSLQAIITDLLTFQILPYATCVLSGIAVAALLITYTLYDKVMLLGTDSKLVSTETDIAQERQLLNVIEEMKVAAGMRYMPKVYIIEADYMNAFASGYSEKSAMVAITRGLLQKLTRAELQAVMAHELSHIRHLDIKLTLTVAVLSNVMLIVIDILFRGVLYSRNRREDNRLFAVLMLIRVVLPLLTVLLSLYLSRTREFMADAGCVELMRDNEPLATALMKIHDDYHDNADHYQEEFRHTPHEDVRRAAYIFNPEKAGIHANLSFGSMLATHPPLVDRLKAIGFKVKEK